MSHTPRARQEDFQIEDVVAQGKRDGCVGLDADHYRDRRLRLVARIQVFEALRPAPNAPAALRWAPETPINYLEVNSTKLRFIRTGTGPAMVLLHTLRTQIDLFEKLIHDLSKRFTVYALDYPGHGYSDIPPARYDALFVVGAVEGFLEKLDLRDVILAGVSIGGVIPLLIAAKRNARVTRVVSVNPYDYAKGRGLARSSLFAWMTTYASLVPIVVSNGLILP